MKIVVLFVLILFPALSFSAENAPDGKEAQKEAKKFARAGECAPLGYNILKCQQFQCTMWIKSSVKTIALVAGYDGGKCKILYKQSAQLNPRVEPMVVLRTCNVDEDARIILAKEFKSFIDGNDDAYLTSNSDPVLRGQCKIKLLSH